MSLMKYHPIYRNPICNGSSFAYVVNVYSLVQNIPEKYLTHFSDSVWLMVCSSCDVTLVCSGDYDAHANIVNTDTHKDKILNDIFSVFLSIFLALMILFRGKKHQIYDLLLCLQRN
jgi:hypothetical protein